MKKYEKEELSNEELKKYISFLETVKILEMENLPESSIRRIIRGFNIRKIMDTKSGKNYYYIDDINNIINKAKIFFENNYTFNEVMKFKGISAKILYSSKLKSVPIPSGYNAVLLKTRFSSEDYKINRVAYRKDEFDSIFSSTIKSASKNSSTEELSNDELKKYISVTETAKILGMDNFSGEFIRNTVKQLEIRKITNEKSKKVYYHIDDINNILNKVKIFFENHYTFNQVMQFEGISRDKLSRSKLKKIQIPSGYNAVLFKIRFPNENYKVNTIAYKKAEIYSLFGSSIKLALDNSSIEELSNEELKKYIPALETAKILGIDTFHLSTVIEIIKVLDIRKIRIKNKIHCHIDDINNIIYKVKTFFENHYTYDEVMKFEGAKKEKSKLTKVEIPTGYNAVLFKIRFPHEYYRKIYVVYKKDEVDDLEKKYQLLTSSEELNWNNNTEYIPLEQVLQITNFTKAHFVNVIKKSYNIRTLILKRQLLYNKNDINKLIKNQKEFFLEYMYRKNVQDKYFNCRYRYLSKLTQYDAPDYAITKYNYNSINMSKCVFKISEVEEYIENRNKFSINTDIEGVTPVETFNLRLDNYGNWSGFNEDSKYTEQKWFEFIKNRLKRSISKGKVLESLISKYVKCTIIVKEMLERNNKTEIYLLTSSEINLYLRSIDILGQKKVIYRFFQAVYSDILTTGELKKRFFKISEIEEPPRTLPKSKEISDKDSIDIIYDFAVYSKVFKYQISIDLHVKKSIEEIQTKGTATYASVWVYTMLHLNNAWRHGDVRDFPKLEIEDLLIDYNINNIEWFKNNKIDLPLARAIIYRVIQWEFIISKTQIKGRFFCSDELAPSIATAIIILTIFNNDLMLDSSKTLMKFNTKFNEVNSNMLKRFFKEINIKDFTFSSKKFNKSIMTYITYLANMSGDDKSIEYAKTLRGHKRIGSTLNYIDFNIEAVEELSKMLFARGEFGYVASLLINKLNNGVTKDFKEITEQVYAVNKLFGDANKINTTVAFLNSVRTDREAVMNYLSTMSLKECQEKLTDLFARNLPSKEGSDIQCLHSKNGCQRNDLESCFECPYHIPSIYALSTLCDSLTHDMDIYNSSHNKVKKFRLSIKIYRKKKILIEAIQTFGKDYVYGCLGMPRDKFLDRLAMVEDHLMIQQQ